MMRNKVFKTGAVAAVLSVALTLGACSSDPNNPEGNDNPSSTSSEQNENKTELDLSVNGNNNEIHYAVHADDTSGEKATLTVGDWTKELDSSDMTGTENKPLVKPGTYTVTLTYKDESKTVEGYTVEPVKTNTEISVQRTEEFDNVADSNGKGNLSGFDFDVSLGGNNLVAGGTLELYDNSGKKVDSVEVTPEDENVVTLHAPKSDRAGRVSYVAKYTGSDTDEPGQSTLWLSYED